jgi:hypothetical protein
MITVGLSAPGHVAVLIYSQPGVRDDRSMLAKFIRLLFALWVASRRSPRAGA